MLSEEQFSACIEALTRLGAVERVPGHRREGERLRLNVKAEGLLARIITEGKAEPPEGVDPGQWYSCVITKLLLEEKNIEVSKEEFVGMAAVIMGFMSEGAAMQELHSRYDRPLISHKRAERRSK
jgi:hypothetical protein